MESIISHIEAEKYASPIEALDGALQFANMQILRYAAENPEFKGMGTTACIVLMQGDDVWIAHVGDSRIYLYLGKEKQLNRITKDHSYVQTLVDAGEITDDEAEHHPNKNRIMKALGIKPELQPSFNHENRPVHPKKGDVFLICSDGLCGMIPDRTIERVLGEKLTLHEKGEKLIELAMIGEIVQPGGRDNCTLELIEVDNSPWNQSEFMSYNPVPSLKPEQEPVEESPVRESSGLKRNKVLIVLAVLLVLVLAVWGGKIGYHKYICKKAENNMIEASKNAEKIQTKLNEYSSEHPDAKDNISALRSELDTASKKSDAAEKYFKNCGCKNQQ